ncbi:unnamed protein product [Gadus morhua 'NCC']
MHNGKFQLACSERINLGHGGLVALLEGPVQGPQLLVPLPDLLRVSGGPSPLQTDCDEMRLDTLVVHDPACL